MKISIVILLLVAAYTQTCGKGGLRCENGDCHYPAYLQGCLTYSLDNTCAECQYNYQLADKRCLYAPNSQGADCCAQFNTTTSACVVCAKGLSINPASGLCEDRKIDGCIVKIKGACSVCASDYDHIGSICVKAITGCTSYDQDLRCISCSSSFTLKQGVCLPVPSIPSVPNCKFLSEYGCIECNSGWTAAADGTCKPTPLGCLVVKSDGSCQTCQSPFFQLQNGRCTFVGCLQANENACTQCNSALGYVLSNGVCTIPNCIYFTPAGCSACQGGQFAGSWGCKSASERVCLICKNNEYLATDGQCRPKSVHCNKYQNGVCISCCENYFLDAINICKQKQFGCVYSNGACSSCLSPFTFNNGQCLINGCLTYNAQGCASCDSRLVLNNFICTIPFCQRIEGFKCVTCVSGYQLTNQGCAPIDPNCATRNSNNVCLKCNDNYQLSHNGICVSIKVGCNYVDGICTSCRSPFTYVPSTQSCVIDGCLNYFIGGCSQCDDKYKLLYNSCKLPNCLISNQGKCIECDPDYVFTSLGVCVSKDEFCDKMDEFGKCIKCLSTHFFSQTLKKCVKKAAGCIYDNEVCCSCIPPFTFANGRCSIMGCQTLAESGCLACSYPFQLNSLATCEIAQCNAYQNGSCVGCKQGFALSKGKLCIAQDPNCLNYNLEQTECQTCIKGYRFDQNKRCEYADEHCWQFDESGICMNCDRIYFLNPFGKCQLRDPLCLVYTNGYCTQCRPYYYISGGVCMANLKNCKVQKSTHVCRECDQGFILKDGICRAKTTQLSWNSIEMDFGESDEDKTVFTPQFTDNSNLIQAIAKGSAQVYFSSSALANAQFQVDSQGASGWSPINPKGSFIGVKTSVNQIFYALDIRVLTGSTLKDFTVEYSYDGASYTENGKYSLEGVAVDTVKTVYITPVEAKFIRIVAKSGTPHIKIEFYFSSGQVATPVNSSDVSYITKTLVETLDNAYGGESICSSEGLCWAGVQSCEPRKLSGFEIIYTTNSTDCVNAVTIDYSMDGITYTCWNNCKQFPLSNNGFVFPSALLAQKVHVHFAKYSGKPRFGIKFNWAS